jgi:hypothetical protein
MDVTDGADLWGCRFYVAVASIGLSQAGLRRTTVPSYDTSR